MMKKSAKNKNPEIIKSIKETTNKIRKFRKAYAIMLFGSHAKGKAKPISDIDIAVMIKDNDVRTETEIAGLSSRTIDVVLFHRLPLYIKFEVLRDGKPLFIRNKTQLNVTKRTVLREYLDTEYLYRKIGKRVIANE